MAKKTEKAHRKTQHGERIKTATPLKDTFDFIYAFIYGTSEKVGNGYPPTFQQIVSGLGLHSKNTVEYRLNVLEEKGYLKRDRKVARSIVLLKDECLEELETIHD